MERGTVLRMEKTSIYDGEGLRTVVYLKGCAGAQPLNHKKERSKKALEEL